MYKNNIMPAVSLKQGGKSLNFRGYFSTLKMGYIITILKIEAKITAITSTFTSIFCNSSKTQAKIAAIAVINASISQPRENTNTKNKRLP